MSTSLAEVLPSAEGKTGVRVWLKSSGYARRLLLGAEGDPWIGAAPYLAFFSQTQGLLRPDVAVVEVGDLFHSWLNRHPDLVAEMGARRRAAVPLRKMLDEEEPRRVLNEVVEAVLAHLRGRVPLVLSLPSPRAWLVEAKAVAGLGDLAVDDDAIEDAAMYVADLLRAVSSHSIGGVLFEEEAEVEIDDTGLAAYRPLLNVAKHYRWGVVLRGRLAAGLDPAGLAEVDAVISDRPPVVPVSCVLGVDVGDRLWRGERFEDATPGRFRFVEIPVDGRPEAVLEALERLR